MHKFPQLSTSDLFTLLDNSQIRLIDTRPIDSYNGWCFSGENRSGHIKNAHSLPFKWSQYIDWPEIISYKKIDYEHKVILYGDNPEDVAKVACHFAKTGFNDVNIYPHFISEWCKKDKLPMSRLFRYTNLVSASWLYQLLSKKIVSHIPNNRFVLGHTYYYDKGIYDQGHIPGAIAVDTNDLESPQTWNRRTPEELKKALEALGIDHNTTVILYGSFSPFNENDPFPGRNAGHIAAMRCAFIMLYAGVKDVRILNGGMQAWLDEKYPISTEPSNPDPIDDFGIPIPKHPEFAVDIDGAREILKSNDKNLVCVRSWNEYIGQTSGYNYISKKGRIPGAVFANCGSDAYHMENYRNVDYTTREYHEIESIWAQSGIIPQKHNSFYCGTGWRASEAFINAWLMGWPEISVFDGGWFEWSNDDSNPFETGLPE